MKIISGLLFVAVLISPACAADFDIGPSLDACNVSWDVPGPSSQQSMPIGNGDIGLNVWVEPTGDLAFYIGKTDCWNVQNDLPKIGGMHISMNPNGLAPGAPYVQVLKLHESEIDIKEGTGASEIDLRVWVDANHPVIRVEGKSGQPISYKVTLDDWRKDDISSQRTSPDQTNEIVWYHRNPNGEKVDPHLQNITFGAVAKGPGLVIKGDTELDSSAPTSSQLLSIVVLTATTDTPDAYLSQLGDLAKQIESLDLETTRTAHQKWWDDFWHRSWIFASGTKEATECTEGYVLQRYVTACAGRGAYPIKFNGSIFVVDNPTHLDGKKQPQPKDADYRTWGGGYWYQNTRAMYWPRLQAGDFDELLPLFRMYQQEMKENKPLVKAYYGHDGSYFAEQQPFWQKLKYVGREMPENWNDHYFTDILDMGMMMLDYYEYTGDMKFAKETAIPMITDGLTFFNQHFYLGPDGKLLLDNDNAIEMYWKATDPAPDIAGLHAILTRMIALPDDLVDAKTRAGWVKMQSILPDLPRGTKNGKEVLLPYRGPQTMRAHNGENPELYAIYPFRLYGLELPDYDLALRTYFARRVKQEGCWAQDPVQSAMMGLTDEAARHVHFNLTRTDPNFKFLAFWAAGHDYMPDEDNGGNGESGFQQMLLQSVGKKLLVLPAWPKDWDVDYKLNAPFQTTVQVSYKGGKIVDLIVTPPERKTDVIDLSGRMPYSPPKPVAVGEAGTVSSIISPGDPIAPLKLTVKGQPNVLNDDQHGQGAESAIDGNLESKYYSTAQASDATNPHGEDTGLVVTPSGHGAVTAVQFATANDVPDRDPLAITVEGSNDPNAGAAGGNGFALLYDGPTGLEIDPGRNAWGPVLKFPNSTEYRIYRVLVTRVRGDSTDGVQYSEVRLGN